MSNEQEIRKLVNVLRRTARMAQQAAWADADSETTKFSIEQYNRVLARLKELDEGIEPIFGPLEDDSSLSVVAMACRQLSAYFEEDARANTGWGRIYGAAFDTDSFKEFWRQSAKDIEDLGEFIRENIDTWARQRDKSKAQATEEEEGNAQKSDG